MATGIVKWFNENKGYGFIKPENGDTDVFVHISALDKSGIETLIEGDRVSYEIATEKGKKAATNIEKLS